MKRRQFISTLGIGAAGATLAACGQKNEVNCGTQTTSTGSETPIKWKLVTSWPKNFPGLGTGPENFARIVNDMSKGRLTIHVHGAGEIVPPLEVFDAVSNGAAEMGHSGPYYWKGKSPATQFFTSIPFGMNAQEINSWIHYGGGLEIWRKLYAQFNLVPFSGGNTGVQMAGWFNKEINSLNDIQGLKMRIPGLGGEVFKRLGGIPVMLPGGELFTALQTGTIDALEWVGPYNDLAFGFYKVAKYYYYPGWQEPGAMLEFTVNKTKFDSLPPDLQAIVTHATRVVNQDMLDEYTARNNAALKTLVDEHKVELRKLPDEVLKKLHQTANEIAKETAAFDAITQEVYDSAYAFMQGVIPYHRISEHAYYNAREL